jgi:dipeptidyl aminopeptidase/acylaminoacyl peptidase
MRQSFAPAACALSACLLMPLVAFAAPHPFNVDDLVRLQRVSDPALSPDGRTVVYTVRETDMAANRGRTDLWALDLDTKGAQPRRLTTHPEGDSSPEWTADGREIYFLSTRSGSSQVWRLPANGGEAIQVTNLPLDVGSFHVASTGGHLAVTLEVFPDCDDLQCTVDRLKQTKDARTAARSSTASSCATGIRGATAASHNCSRSS